MLFPCLIFAFGTGLISADIDYTVPNLVLAPPDASITKALGKSTLITCRVDSPDFRVANPNLRWFDYRGRQVTTTISSNRVHIERDGDQTLKLYIDNIVPNDAGNYTCKGMIEGTEQQKTIRLDLYKEITFDHAPSPQHPKLHDPAALIQCRVSGNPPPLISWKYNNQKIETNEKYAIVQSGLRIMNITQSDDGIYKCQAEVQAEGRYDFRDIVVEVHVPPYINKGPGNVEGIEGHEATIECESRVGKPQPKWEFYKDDLDNPLSNTQNRIVDTEAGAVHFRPLHRDHKGRYRCKAINDVGDDEKEGEMVVIIPPLVFPLINVTNQEGQSVTIRCECEGFPEPKMTFRKTSNNFEYQEGSNENGRIIVTQTGMRLEMTIQNLNPDDSHNYTCKAENAGGFWERNGTVVVRYSPRFRPEDNEQEEYGWPGKTRNLTCRVQAEPIAYVDWIHNQRILENNETFRIYRYGYDSSLQIFVREMDTDWVYGEYTCRAKNDYGTNDLPFYFIRGEVPERPDSASVKDDTPTMVILTVVPPTNDGGVPIFGYRVEYDTHTQDFLLHEQIRIEHLRPLTPYLFNIRAKNEVGMGNPLGLQHTTKDISVPYPLKITSDPWGPYPHRYTLQWERPETGGLPIKEYRFYYRRVKIGDNLQVVEVLEDWIMRIKDDDPSAPIQYYLLEGLKSDQPYQAEIKARNDIGWSLPNSEFVFVTSQSYNPPVIEYSSTTTADGNQGEVGDGSASLTTLHRALYITVTVITLIFSRLRL